MTAAALLLAAALVVAPGPSRRRLALAPSSPRTTRWTWPGFAVVAVACAFVVPVTAVAAGAMVATVVQMRRRSSAARARRGRESIALQGALSVLVGELRIGAHPVVAFETAAAEVDGATAVALRAVAARARLGADVAAGLRSVARESTLSGHWARLAVCWQLAQSQGLAISTLVRAAQRDIVERERFASHVTAGMAGARATAAILAGLPVLGIGLGQLIGAEPLNFLVSDGAGGWLLLVGVAFACAGLWWSDRIVDRVTR